MGVEVYTDENHRGDVFVCNTTDTAFGPVMEEGSGELFLEWLTEDPRVMDPDDLVNTYATWYDHEYMRQVEEEEE